MNTRHQPTLGHDADFSPENRDDRRSTPLSPTSAHTGPVTVGRANGVVQPSSGTLWYEADAAGHRVVARYADGQLAFAFGSLGDRPGQFNTPLHVTEVSPEFSGEPGAVEHGLSVLTPWLAVADYGNHRVQLFECDGAFLGEIELEAGQPPCHLTWRAPVLDVTTVEGRTVRLHVAAALLARTHRDDRHDRRHHNDPQRVWRVC